MKKGFAIVPVSVFMPIPIVLFFCSNASAEEKTALLETNSNVRFTQS